MSPVALLLTALAALQDPCASRVEEWTGDVSLALDHTSILPSDARLGVRVAWRGSARLSLSREGPGADPIPRNWAVRAFEPSVEATEDQWWDTEKGKRPHQAVRSAGLVLNESSARLSINCAKQTYELQIRLGRTRMRSRLFAPPDVVAQCDQAKAQFEAKGRNPIEALATFPCAALLKALEETDATPLTISFTIQGETFDARSAVLSGTREVRSDNYYVGGVLRPTVTWHLRPGAGERLEPRADAGGPYEVERGGVATLDGSRSRGVDNARWRIAQRCSDGSASAPVDRDGLRTEVTVLCDLDATLTVSGNGRSSTASARVRVKPPGFKTRYSMVTGALDAGPPLASPCPDGDRELCASIRGGTNACTCGNEFHTFHPGPAREDNQTLDGKGYLVRAVEDPGGPFHGWWYVKEYRLDVPRAAQVNRWVAADAKPPLTGYGMSFYALNKHRGNDVDGYLKAIADHEGEGDRKPGHGRLIREWLEAHDPAREMERLAVPPSAGRAELVRRADELLRTAEVEVCEASRDPLPRIWKGNLVVHASDGTTDEKAKDGARAPIKALFVVGGENYGSSGSCAPRAPAPSGGKKGP
jgi:hypothetical protein